MATVNGIMKKNVENNGAVQVKSQSVAAIMNNMLDSSGYRKRIDDLLKNRAAQFCSSLITIANSTKEMQQAAIQSPMSILQTGLKAATYDLPLGSELGYAYPVAFFNGKGNKYECQFIMGYKGLYQLAMRTGVYSKLNVCDIRQGELKSWNPLTEDIEIEFVQDEEQRQGLPIVGYCGFFRTKNGMEKYVYWSVEKIKKHEEKHRKGKYQNPVWKTNEESMSRKTVLRDLITHWGLMSIDYRTSTVDTVDLADKIASGKIDDENNFIDVDSVEAQTESVGGDAIDVAADGRKVDTETGELFPN